jgi:hypothetical protein
VPTGVEDVLRHSSNKVIFDRYRSYDLNEEVRSSGLAKTGRPKKNHYGFLLNAGEGKVRAIGSIFDTGQNMTATTDRL